MNKFRKAGWPYVNRHHGSKGIADIVAVRKGYDYSDFFTEVAFIQAKKEKVKKNHHEEKKALTIYCAQMLALPIWAEKEKGRIKLTDLSTNKRFKP